MASRRRSPRRQAYLRAAAAQWNLCGKVTYVARSGALAAARFQGERYRTRMRAYRCPKHGWHLTSQRRRHAKPSPARLAAS